MQPAQSKRETDMNCVLYREGASPGDRWKWNETIGPVVDRPGREGEY
jgi:hypothetical protein